MKILNILAFTLIISACAIEEERVAIVLEPAPDSVVWPQPPDPPHYSLVGQLIGERDFIQNETEVKKNRTVMSWLTGLIYGEKKYTELNKPISGMRDKKGRILVVDASLKAVMVFDLEQKQFLKWDRISEFSTYASPIAISGDGKGGFFVTDSELGKVFHIDENGIPLGNFGEDVLNRPTGIARDPFRHIIYVSDTAEHNIKVFTDDGNLIDVIGTRGSGVGEFNSPTHLTFVESRLYITDTLNFRIQVIDGNLDNHLTFGSLGINLGNMVRPKGIAVGGDGRIYVVESYFDHLLIYSNTGEFLLPIGGTGYGDGQFYLPNGVWTDTEDNVYVADMFNGRVSIFRELSKKR